MPNQQLKLGVLVSGNGTNLQAILEACAAKKISAEVAVVISNNPDAYALKRAEQFSVPTQVVPNRRAAESDIITLLKQYQVDLICLAGFMRILSAEFIREYPHQIINIHPSLLPAFPGLEAQRQALEAGVKMSGATVHFVDEGCDTGPIILQGSVAVADNETLQTLREKILKVEHQIYPEAIQLIATQGLKIKGRHVLRNK